MGTPFLAGVFKKAGWYCGIFLSRCWLAWPHVFDSGKLALVYLVESVHDLHGQVSFYGDDNYAECDDDDAGGGAEYD